MFGSGQRILERIKIVPEGNPKILGGREVRVRISKTWIRETTSTKISLKKARRELND